MYFQVRVAVWMVTQRRMGCHHIYRNINFLTNTMKTVSFQEKVVLWMVVQMHIRHPSTLL